jgi:hypothetical protein
MAMTNWNIDQPAPKALWKIIHSRFPDRTRFLGISMPPGYEDHSEGRALDVGIRAWIPREKRLADDLVGALNDFSFEIMWSYFIWNRQITYSDARGGPLPYERAAKMPHTEHIHISWSRGSSGFASFPGFANALDGILRDESGGVEDDATQSSFTRPYSSP